MKGERDREKDRERERVKKPATRSGESRKQETYTSPEMAIVRGLEGNGF
jgi:hypothetical protein